MPALLVITPHPDDEAYAFGGTIARLAGAGWRCAVHCASSGERGKRHDGGALERLGEDREAELARSCAILGADPPACWRLPDGGLREADAAGLARAAGAIASARPELVLTLGADGAYGHPDHLAVHRWVCEAWSRVRGSERPALLFAAFPRGLFLPQWEKCRAMLGEPPHPPAAAIGSDEPAVAVDIRQVAGRKLLAIGAHGTQLPGGDPQALFPADIVGALLRDERFVPADPVSERLARQCLGGFAALAG